MNWHFSPQPSDQVETEITQRDQFDNDEVKLAETIIREAIQNSLDAAISYPIKVKVTFDWIDKDKGLKPDFFQSLFNGQMEHAKAAGIDIESLDFNNPTALVIEDYGTSGLTGQVTVKDNDHFSDFWRRHGKSHKTGTSRGRWGLGKLVYSSVSEIGVFWGITVRPNDSNTYLMGQTVLNLRSFNNLEYPPHAYFSDLEHEEDHLKRITVPIKSESLVNQFISNFSIQRKQEPGLSLVIPFPNKNFDIEEMIGIAISNYFYPIITGQLQVRFSDIEINQSNVRELAKRYATKRLDNIDLLFDFIEEVYEVEASQKRLTLKPSWLDDNILDERDFDSESLTIIKEKYSRGELIAISLPVTIKSKNGNNKSSSFSVYLKRPVGLDKGVDLYVRGGLTLPSESKFKNSRLALGAMIAEDEAICAFLGDAENPAHTKWTTNTQKLTENYRNSQPVITAIKKSVLWLYDLLAEKKEEREENALLDFFWFDEPEVEKNRKKLKKPKPPKNLGEISTRNPKFHLSQTKDGFELTNSDYITKQNLPLNLTVEVAYEVIRGNAFKKYNSNDFKVGKNGNISILATESVRVLSGKENKWEFEINDVEFSITARGFDSNRDLKIKAS